MAILHTFVSGVADGSDSDEVRPSNWNEPHTIQNDTVTYAQLQNVSATDKLLGRSSSGAGDVEEIACTAAGRALLDDADAAAQRTTLALADIAASGSGADLGAGTVALSKLANLTTQRVIGRNSGGSGVPEEATASQLLDWVTSTNGVLLTRTAGSWAAAANVAIDGGDIVHTSTSPTTPAAGRVKTTRAVNAGREMLGFVSPDAIASIAQPHIGREQPMIALPIAASNNQTTLGCSALTVSGTATSRAMAATNLLTSTSRLGMVSGASAGSLAGVRVPSLRFWRGDAAGRGGFHFIARFAITDAVLVTDAKMFVGLWGTSSAPADVEPSTLTNILGVGCNSTDTELQLYAAGGSAQARTTLGASFPVNTVSVDLYELAMYAPPNASEVRWEVTRLNTGDTLDGTISVAANLPSSTTFLAVQLWRSNSATAAACAIDWTSIYVGV